MKRWHVIYARKDNRRFWACKECGEKRQDYERLTYADGRAIVDTEGSTCDLCGALLRYSYEDVPE